MPRNIRRHMTTSRVSRSAAFVVFLSTAGLASAATPDLRLVNAVMARSTQSVKVLLKEGVDVNTPRADGATPIFWAAHWDNMEMVDLLLQAHANVNAADDHGVTALDLACVNANAAIVEKLLAAGANAKHVQTNGVTPLMTAARTGNLAIVKALLARGADVNAAVADNGQTALMWATAERHHEVLPALIASGANVHVQSKIGFTPLLFAARNGDIEAARTLLAAGAEVNAAGLDGTHALPLAIVSGQAEMAKFLLDNKADPNGTMAGVHALHAAAGAVDMWIREWYRARGVDYSRSAPNMAATSRTELVKTLIAHGADPNARIESSAGVQGWLTLKRGAHEPFSVGTGNLRGATALWVAAFDMHAGVYGSGSALGDVAMSGKPEIVRALLELGADLTLTTEDKTTPLMAATGLGHSTYLPGQKRGGRTPDAEATVKLFVDAGANVNAINEAGFTALHGAAFKGLNEVVEYLVAHGAAINAKDYQGRTAYRMAEGSKQSFQFQEWPETAELLKTLGADVTLGITGREQERKRDEAGDDVVKVDKQQ